jgi:hypothetical protein
VHLSTPSRLGTLVAGVVNPVARLDGRPFDPASSFGPPTGRYQTVHYGVMIPNLPEPHRFLDVVAIIGQPRIPIWRNEHLIRTTAKDTVSLLTATGSMTSGQLVGYSVSQDCEFSPGGSQLRFGDRLVISGSYPDFAVRIDHPEVPVALQLTATDKVTQFARLIGGRYDHWSLLGRYAGEIAGTAVTGLCTLEYARGGALRLPLRSFTYQVLNVDDRTQVLMGQVLGPAGLPVQQAVYVRSLDGYSRTYPRGCRFTVSAYEDRPRPTPDGREMLLPREFSWRASASDGAELIHVNGTTCGDFTYGMAAGFAGSYRYEGRLRGSPIEGLGYLEYIDGR